MILDKRKINKSNLMKLIFSSIVSFILIYYSLNDFDSDKFLKSMLNANFISLFLSMILLVLTIQIRAIRWKFILNKNIKVNNLYMAQLIGYMGNNLLPLRLGEFLKSYYIGKKNKISKFEAFGSVVLERFLDFSAIGFLLILLIQTSWMNEIESLYRNAILSILLLSIVLLLISYYINKTFINKFLKNIPNFLKEVINGFANINSSNIIGSIFLTIFIWSNYILVVYLVQYSFELGLTVQQCILLLLISTVVLSIPSLPGNIGTFEASVVYTLTLYGITDDFGFGFILHSVSFIPYTLLGLFYFVKERKFII